MTDYLLYQDASRPIDERVEEALRQRASDNGRTVEEEARQVLRAAVGDGASASIPAPRNLAAATAKRFASLGGVELSLPEREPVREPPNFS